MCRGCYEEYGSPLIVNNKVMSAVGLIAKVFQFNESGGNLHCELDDWNLEDEFFEDEFRVYREDASGEQICC